MDILVNFLLFLHFASIAAAGASIVAMPLIGRQLRLAAPEARAGYGAIAQQLGLAARSAFGVLLVTGILMVWLRYGGVEALNPWFWVKMAFVVVMAALMAAGIVLRGRVDPRLFAMLTRLCFAAIIIAAVLAFS
jgi:hypothetical protein